MRGLIGMESDGKTDDLPPSAKLVHSNLESDEPMTFGDLRESTELPESTLTWALRKLSNRELIEEQPNTDDARKTEYTTK